MQILDNLLNKKELDVLSNLIVSRNFPYYFHEDIDYEKGFLQDFSNYGFSHNFYSNELEKRSSFFEYVIPILENISKRLDVEIKQILRIRCVLTTNVGLQHQNIKHVDVPAPPVNEKVLTAVYYPIESDGNFYYYENDLQHEIEPVVNRCIVMDNSIVHHGSNPINHAKRIAINVNFICK
jgi:hypothetical protein